MATDRLSRWPRSLLGHSRPMHSVPVPINVGCYSNSDIIVRRRSEVTLRTNKRQCLVRKPPTGTAIRVSINGDSDERDIAQAIRSCAPAVMQALDRGEIVDPASFYFRLSGLFETSALQYDWLNRVIAIGIGDRPPDGPIYSIFEGL